MAKINDKCKKVGDVLTVRIEKCEVVEGNFGEEVKFTTPQGEIYLSRKTADQKLGRIGFATDEGDAILYGEVDGNYLTFSRDPNPKDALKPYWSIARADAPTDAPRPSLADRAKAEAAKVAKEKGLPVDPADAPQDGREKVDAIDRAYAHAYKVAQKVQDSIKDFTPSADSLQAGAATLLIAYDRAGVVHLFAPPKAAPAPAKPAPKKPDPIPPPDDEDDPGPYEPEMDLPF